MVKDKSFYRSFFSMAAVIAIQNLVTYTVNLADNVMIGGYSQDALSGVAIVNQIQFLLQMFSLGVGNGIVVLGAQYWGKKQVEPIRRVTTIGLLLAAAFGLLLAATVYPSNATNKTLRWTSSNESVATVDDAGYITTIGKGVTTITAASTDGSKVSASCSVTVTNNGYAITDKAQLESPHPYESSCTDFWVYTEVGASEIRLTFDRRTEMEEGFDYLHIYNENGILHMPVAVHFQN
jgi:hypothetical protein